MKQYSEDKYKIFVDEKHRKVIAVSTYAGKTVKGFAKADPRDEFNLEKGKALAIARCGQKIAEKRAKRARVKVSQAIDQFAEAQKHLNKMHEYLTDSNEAVEEAIAKVQSLSKQF